MKKRLLSTLLILVMVFSALSVTAFADGSVVEVTDKATLTSEINAANDGDTIKLTTDITSDEVLVIDKPITLDLGENTLTTTSGWGGLQLKNGCSVKNGKLLHTGRVNAIKVWDVVSIEDLVIEVTDTTEGKTVGGIAIQQNAVGIDLIKNVTMQGEGLDYGIETYNCGNATEPVIGAMENVTIDAAQTGMLISAPCGTATNCSISGGVSGIEIWIKGTYSASLELVNCDVEGGEQAVYAHDEFNSSAGIENIGELELTADSATTFDSDNGALLALTNAHGSNIDVENVIAGAEAKVVDANGTETYYATVEEAEDAADTDAGETVENLKLLEIWDVEDLVAFRDAVNIGETFDGKLVKLMADVDLAGIEWTPIGGYDASATFMGTFDGGNHTISNMTITKTDDASAKLRLGLFSNVTNATIQNLTLKDSKITAESSNVRASVLVMTVNTSGTISNVTVDGAEVNVTSGDTGYAAGVVGYTSKINMSDITVKNVELNAKANAVRASAIAAYHTQNDSDSTTLDSFVIENVMINAEAVNGGTYIGGAFGLCQKGNRNTVGLGITNGTVDGLTIVSNATGEGDVGGLIGYTYKVDPLKVEDVEITNLDIDFTGASSKVGGVTGREQSVSRTTGGYKNVSVSGTIDENATSNSGSEVGGFVGISYYYPKTYTDCSADVDVTTTNRAGGFVGTPCPNGWSGQTDLYSNCTASGDVTAPVAGGFVGCAWLNASANTTLKLEKVTATGAVSGTTHAGGLIGGAFGSGGGCSNIIIEDSTASVSVTGPANNTAGVVGQSGMASGKKIELVGVNYTIEPPINPSTAPVVIKEYVVKIGDEKYLTLTEAIEAAQDGDTIELIGDHSTTSEIVLPADMELTIDASAADFGDLENVKVRIDRIVDNTNEFENDKSGEYTLTGFKLNGSLSVGTSATTLKVSDCELAALDLNASNTTVIVEDNKINSTGSNKRFDGGNSDFGLYVYADQIDLTVENNEIEAVDSAIVVQGNWPYFLSGENSISIFDNKLRTEEGNIFSTWNFNTYAPVEWPAEYQITDEMKALTKQIIEENNLAGMCEKDIVKVLCRANGMSDISVTEKHELLKDVADMSGLHSWGDWEVTKYPTMYAEGEETRYCTVDGCDGYETRTLAKLPYVPADPAYTIKNNVDEVSLSARTAEKGEKVYIELDGIEIEDILVLDRNGDEIEIHEDKKGYYFKMPYGTVTIEPCEAKVEPAFIDVDEDDYYYDAVLWAVENGITNGTSATTFSPDAVCTRAQVVTFLWRAAGEPAPKSVDMPFTDVAEGAYYYDAILWAVENGITNGTSATTFSPDADCTRGQIVTFLWRSQGAEDASAYNPFVDVADGAYYEDAVLWAVENGITNGTGANTFSPDADCTRGQIVTFLYRCLAE